MKRVLFVCIHNSARSQMAEELLRKKAPQLFDVESAGINPGELNPLAVEVLEEEGIEIKGKQTQSVQDKLKSGEHYDYVITVCDEASAEECPVFPGGINQLHWSFKDPSRFEGTWKERLEKTRLVKDEIKLRVKEWVKNFQETGANF